MCAFLPSLLPWTKIPHNSQNTVNDTIPTVFLGQGLRRELHSIVSLEKHHGKDY